MNDLAVVHAETLLQRIAELSAALGMVTQERDAAIERAIGAERSLDRTLSDLAVTMPGGRFVAWREMETDQLRLDVRVDMSIARYLRHEFPRAVVEKVVKAIRDTGVMSGFGGGGMKGDGR